MRMPAIFLLTAALAAGAPARGFDHDHAAWSALLSRHVVLIDGGKASQVRYDGFLRERAALKGYLETLSRVSAREFEGWNKAQRAAFLINAYNAATVEKILTRYPGIGSIWDFGKVFGNPFRDRFIRLLGRPVSLDDIEHGMLRAPGAYAEPRIHFAVSCASVGCPMLREEAYRAERLVRQLEEQTRRFLADRARNRYDPAANRLEVSRIFDWYAADWTSGYRGLEGNDPPLASREQFFARYADLLADEPEHRAAVRERRAGLAFLEYDWALNAARP
ncbi:MAG: DUF547 domain-containing protein [Burkholderiales bacterium]|nr:DUF547 domain-containing protein [Burkholderiales bacterium]